MRKWAIIFGILVLGICGFSPRASADWRRYVWTYEYLTMPEGGWELENYLTFKVPEWAETRTNSLEEQIEIEYGITNRWDVALYNRLERINQAGGGSTTFYKGFKVRMRYRFGEEGAYPLDPLLYVEWVRDVRRDRNPDKLEGKLILAKELGRFNVAYNQIVESRLGSGGRTEHGFAAGVSYPVSLSWILGMEAKGDYYRPGGVGERFSLGPTVSWLGDGFWFAGGTLFGLNRAADDFGARLLIGILL